MNNDFKELIKEARKNNYIEAKQDSMLLSCENAKKLEEKGFEINAEIVEKLLDVFNDEKHQESKIKFKNRGKIIKEHYENKLLSGIEITLNNGEKIMLTNSRNGGYKIYKLIFNFIPKKLCICNDIEKLEKLATKTLNSFDEMDRVGMNSLRLFAYIILDNYKSTIEIKNIFDNY